MCVIQEDVLEDFGDCVCADQHSKTLPTQHEMEVLNTVKSTTCNANVVLRAHIVVHIK